ncbi:MAG: XdhC family protein [Desulfovibrionaceae bacterium]
MSNLRHDNRLWEKARALGEAATLLRNGHAVVLATAVTRDGAGSRLLATPAGAILDRAEGGLLEDRVRAGILRQGGAGPATVVCDAAPLGELTGEDAAVYGPLARLVLDRFDPEPGQTALVTALAEALADGRPGTLVTRLSEPGAGERSLVLAADACRGVPLPDAVVAAAGRLGLGPEGSADGLTVFEIEGGRYLLDGYRPLPPVYFAGAGQVSRMAVPLAVLSGFRTVVLDDDPAFANRERFPNADQVRVAPEFVDCFAGEAMDGEASVVIVTRGHAFDRVVMAQALRTEAGYVGLMGCRADGRAQVLGLGQVGFGEAALARVRTPIGLPIGGKTPAAIAMSIVAELIEARSARLRGKR